MNDTSMVKYETTKGIEITLTKEDIKRYLCPNASDQEVMMFLQLCKHQKLNPWLREAYLIKYGTQPATMVVGWHVFLMRADSHPAFNGYEVDVFCPDGTPYRGKGEIGYAEARVHRKDRQYPTTVRALFREYSTGRAMWAPDKIPSTMIRKVALAQALREAFTNIYSGIYTAEEMRMNPDELPTKPIERPEMGRIIEHTDIPDEPDDLGEIGNDVQHASASNDTRTILTSAPVSMSVFAAVKYLANLYGGKWASAVTPTGELVGEYYFGVPIKGKADLDEIFATNPDTWQTGTSKLLKDATHRK